MGCKAVRNGQLTHIMEVAGPFGGVSLRNSLSLLACNGIRIYGFPFGSIARGRRVPLDHSGGSGCVIRKTRRAFVWFGGCCQTSRFPLRILIRRR